MRHSTIRATGGAFAVGLAVSSAVIAAPAGAHGSIKRDLHRLRVCESGNNYHANTGNGYYGAYQFSRSTWRGLGFHKRPDQAKRKTQDRAAKKEHAISGWSAWPSCSQREHLR
ncbi:MAG: transglycosylase family protein [Frankiaceae bacterium]|nr:transglycosylase family protein [Frankiaceae bacterium]